MTGYKHLFARSLGAAPERLHMAAHSHHLWPDASWLGQQAAWEDAAWLADRKWDRVMGEIWPAAQAHVADELHLPDPTTVLFTGNTHDVLTRIVSAIDARPVRILATDGEFHSFARQAARWEEAGLAVVERVAVEPVDTLGERLVAAAAEGGHHLVWISQTLFGSGRIAIDLGTGNAGGWLPALGAATDAAIVVDGYHGFMAVETDLSAHAGRVFYTAGGYKYAMAGEGVAFMHAPPGVMPRPVQTGWYAAFSALEAPGGGVPYAADAMRFMGSTFDPSGLYRFVAVRDMLAREGLTTAGVSAHVATLMARLESGLAATSLGAATVVNPAVGSARARFLSLRHPAASAWQRALMEEGVVTDVRGDVLRIGLGLYHDERDVERFLSIAAALG